jgi:hypothetical protein
MGGLVLQVESLFETTMGGRLTGQINIWWLPTSPLGLPVKLCFTASLVKGMGCIYYSIGTFKLHSFFF